jgi:hypothetical protein
MRLIAIVGAALVAALGQPRGLPLQRQGIGAHGAHKSHAYIEVSSKTRSISSSVL